MTDVFMTFSAIVLFILFMFLFFQFVIIIISFFRKKVKINYEPKISVVIPCYNEERNIMKCLNSVFASNYDKKKIEVIVVDDGSTDNTVTLLKKHSKKIRIIAGKHQGKSVSLNLGCKKAKHDYILTIDADVILDKNAIRRIVRPFKDKNVGAVNGSSLIRNSNTVLTWFQKLEYLLNNHIRKSFSDVFNNSVWFFGAFACYRKSLLQKIKYFKQDTLTEDMEISLGIYYQSYKIKHVYDAIGYTLAPNTIKEIIKQRTRWWLGGLQALNKHRKLFSRKSNFSILFLFINQYWWTIYAFLAIPIIVYQYNFWLSTNLGSFSQLFWYTFRWFSLFGPVHVLYMIPKWGISFISIFGVLSGIITSINLLISIKLFKEKQNLSNLVALLFYFPYTILLNFIIVLSVFRALFSKNNYFVN